MGECPGISAAVRQAVRCVKDRRRQFAPHVICQFEGGGVCSVQIKQTRKILTPVQYLSGCRADAQNCAIGLDQDRWQDRLRDCFFAIAVCRVRSL